MVEQIKWLTLAGPLRRRPERQRQPEQPDDLLEVEPKQRLAYFSHEGVPLRYVAVWIAVIMEPRAWIFVKIKISTAREFFARVFDLGRLDGR
jgi:hypothetical protein